MPRLCEILYHHCFVFPLAATARVTLVLRTLSDFWIHFQTFFTADCRFGAAVNAGLWVKANLTKPYDRRAVAFVQGVYFFGIAAARATFDESDEMFFARRAPLTRIPRRGWRADQLGFALNPLGVLGNLYGSDIFVGCKAEKKFPKKSDRLLA